MAITLESVVRDAVEASRGLKKTASRPTDDAATVLVELDKVASDPSATSAGLMKTASQTIRDLQAKYNATQDRLQALEKVSSVRSRIDTMLDAGLISRYDVREKLAELLENDNAYAFSGNVFAKTASGTETAVETERGIFSSVVQ